MYNLGIMQGRIYPANKKEYNLFPLSWETEINKLKKVGFDYVELLYDREESTNNPICRNSSHLGKLTKISKGKLYSINLDYFTKNNFFTDIDKSKKILQHILSISKRLKIKVIIIPCIEKNLLSKDKLLHLLKYLKKNLSSRSPKISIEIDNFKNIIKNNLNQKIGICFDTGNIASKSKNFIEEIFKFKNQINHFHLKDKKKINKTFVNCPLGEGIVDIKNFFITLHLINYKGAITFETSYKSNPLKEAEKNLEFVKKIIL